MKMRELLISFAIDYNYDSKRLPKEVCLDFIKLCESVPSLVKLDFPQLAESFGADSSALKKPLAMEKQLEERSLRDIVYRLVFFHSLSSEEILALSNLSDSVLLLDVYPIEKLAKEISSTTTGLNLKENLLNLQQSLNYFIAKVHLLLQSHSLVPTVAIADELSKLWIVPNNFILIFQ